MKKNLNLNNDKYKGKNLIDDSLMALRNGDTAYLLSHRGDLSRAAEVKGGNEKQKLQSRALAISLNTLMFDKVESYKLLTQFVEETKDKKVKAIETELDKLEQNLDSFTVGLFFSAVANFLFRNLAFSEGIYFAQKAHGLLLKDDDSVDPLLRLVVKAENTSWLVRLLTREEKQRDEKQQEAEQLLRQTIDKLVECYKDFGAAKKYRKDERGGLDLELAIALNLWAAFLWTRGDLEAARQKIYRALFLLRDGNAQDPIRLAHSLFVSGKIEASYSTANFEWALLLLREAEDIFKDNRHPLASRCAIQSAQCLHKASRSKEAGEVLTSALTSITQITDDVERSFAEAEWAMTQVWILEDEARAKRREWEDCRKESQKFFNQAEAGKLPRRLKAEAYLHHGLVLVHLGRYEDGRKQLHKATEIAKQDGRIKINVAAYFALTESYIGPEGDPTEAKRFWTEGLRLFANVQSTFLERWEERLAPEVAAATKRGMLIAIDPTQRFEDVEKEFKRTFLRGYLASESDPWDEDSLKKRGLSRPTLYRWCRKLKVALPGRKAS